MNNIVLIFILLVGAGLAVVLSLLMRARKEQALEHWLANRKSMLLKILVPRNNEKTPASAQNLFASLHGIFRADAQFHEHISFEIVATARAIEFYVHGPAEIRDFIEGQIYAQYPDVEMHEVGDYTQVDLANLKIATTELSLTKPDVYPIKTFLNFEVDPLAGITGVLSNMSEHEQIWIQYLARPISDTWQHKGIRHTAAMRSGNANTGSIFKMLFKALVDLLRPQPPAAAAKPAGPPASKLSGPQELALKAIEEKVTKLGYETKIRILALAPDATTVNAKINSICGAYKQFNTTNMNGFKVGKIINDHKGLDQYRRREFLDQGQILNIEELASVYHFPNLSVETPNIVWAGSKKGEPPAALPIEGIVAPEEITLFGVTDFRGHRQKFGIKLPDRQLHFYAIGKSGTGKSTMLENMAIDDIRKGRGVAIVDPHGDFVNNVLDFIPASRINDVIYFNPADKDFPVGFNLLESVDPELKNIVASGLMSIFTKLWENVWSARMEYILRNAILALLEYPDATMLQLMKLLNDQHFRAKVLEKVKDPVIRDFFINEYNKWDPKFRTEAIAALQNKIGQFLSSSTIRNIVGQPKSTFDIEDAMNNRKIVLFDLSMGKIGEDSSALLGAMMITKIQLAAMRRANISDKAERVNFYLYIDEFQNFATDSFKVILSEARKYHLNLILTHQYIGQLPEEVAKAIFGNVGTLISFRVGSSDAVALVKEFEPVFEANDMVNLANHHIYAKMSIDGVARPAFSAITLVPATDRNNNRDKIIRVSRERYARPRDYVEKKIIEISEEERQEKETFEATVAARKTGRQALKIELEGNWYEGKQGSDGKHWFYVVEPPEDTGEGESSSATETVGATTAEKSGTANPDVITKETVDQAATPAQKPTDASPSPSAPEIKTETTDKPEVIEEKPLPTKIATKPEEESAAKPVAVTKPDPKPLVAVAPPKPAEAPKEELKKSTPSELKSTPPVKPAPTPVHPKPAAQTHKAHPATDNKQTTHSGVQTLQPNETIILRD